MDEEDKIQELVNPKQNDVEEITPSEIIDVENEKNLPVEVESEDEEKKLSHKHQQVAELAARGYSVDVISNVTGMKPKSVYRILEKNEDVWKEMNRIMKQMFEEGDRILRNLYLKALKKIDDRMSNPATEEDAIKKVMDIVGKRVAMSSGKEGEKQQPPIVQQFFQNPSNEGPIVEGGTIDDLILKKRAERNLPTKKRPVGSDEEIEDDE